MSEIMFLSMKKRKGPFFWQLVECLLRTKDGEARGGVGTGNREKSG